MVHIRSQLVGASNRNQTQGLGSGLYQSPLVPSGILLFSALCSDHWMLTLKGINEYLKAINQKFWSKSQYSCTVKLHPIIDEVGSSESVRKFITPSPKSKALKP